jgi:hypothetical protein
LDATGVEVRMDERILATVIWLILLFGVPLALALGTVSLWADGLSSAGGKPGFNNVVVLLLVLVYTVIWLLLLRLIYLPGMGYEASITSLTDIFSPTSESMPALQRLFNRFTDWLQREPITAGIRLVLLAAVLAVPLVLARVLGERSNPLPGRPRR